MSATKWAPKLRYAKDFFGVSSVHSGPNRAERRQRGAMVRHGYVDQTTFERHPGQRQLRKRKARKAARFQARLLGLATPRPIGRVL